MYLRQIPVFCVIVFLDQTNSYLGSFDTLVTILVYIILYFHKTLFQLLGRGLVKSTPFLGYHSIMIIWFLRLLWKLIFKKKIYIYILKNNEALKTPNTQRRRGFKGCFSLFMKPKHTWLLNRQLFKDIKALKYIVAQQIIKTLLLLLKKGFI